MAQSQSSSSSSETTSASKAHVEDEDPIYLATYNFFSLVKYGSGIAELSVTQKEPLDDDLEPKFLEELGLVITELENWTTGKCVLVWGLNTFPLKYSEEVSDRLDELMSRLQALPLLTVAVLEGWVSAGGAQVAINADFRVMTNSAHIVFVEWGSALNMLKEKRSDLLNGGSRLAQLLREPKAIETAVSGRPIGAKEATNIGLVQHVVTDENRALNECREWLTQYTKYDTTCLRNMKKIVHYACTLPLDESLKKEKELFTDVWGKAAHKAALAANIKHKSN